MRSPDPILLVLLAASLTTNIYLFHYKSLSGRPVERLEIGQQVPEFVATSIRGDVLRIRFDKPVILYTFSPSCVWCERNLDSARQLAAHVRGKYEFVALALDSKNLEQYVKDNDLSWTVVKNVPANVREAYRMVGTPQTIVVGAGGNVLHVWTGAFLGDIASEIERAFGLKLRASADKKLVVN